MTQNDLRKIRLYDKLKNIETNLIEFIKDEDFKTFKDELGENVKSIPNYLMYNKKQSYNPSTTETFSIRQMDYATSSNGLRFAAGSSTYKFNNIYNAFSLISQCIIVSQE